MSSFFPLKDCGQEWPSARDGDLSKSATKLLESEGKARATLNSTYVKRVRVNMYEPLSNPQGILSLGVAFSYLCDDLLASKFANPFCYESKNPSWHVLHLQGDPDDVSLAELLAEFYTDKFHTTEPINPRDLIITHSVTASLDLVTHCIADPGDVILIPTPAYGYLPRDIGLRTRVDMWPVDLAEPPTSGSPTTAGAIPVSFRLTADKVEKAFDTAVQQGRIVRGILLVNPNNPLGEVIHPDVLYSILELCQRLGIHVLLDEILALTVFDAGPEFRSGIAYDKLPDPERTHIFWSFSKDFSIDGLRVSVVHTRNAAVARCTRELASLIAPSSLDVAICKKIIKDKCERLQ